MENARIRKFMSGLQSLDAAVDREHLIHELGAWMLESHQGYLSVGLGEPVTSRIVELVRTKGRGHGIPGARISGGGSGGTVVVMVSSDEGLDRLMDIKAELENQVEKELTLFEGSSEGAHYIN
jgi:L-arabinokinase